MSFVGRWGLRDIIVVSADLFEEVLELAVKLNVSFIHVSCSVNEVADSLAKEGVGRLALVVVLFPS